MVYMYIRTRHATDALARADALARIGIEIEIIINSKRSWYSSSFPSNRFHFSLRSFSVLACS